MQPCKIISNVAAEAPASSSALIDEEDHGIYRGVMPACVPDTGFEMKMRAGSFPGLSKVRNMITRLHQISLIDQVSSVMSVYRKKPIPAQDD